MIFTLCYRGQAVRISYSSGANWFSNGSTILYECDYGYVRSYTNAEFDLTCFEVRSYLFQA